MVKKDSNSPVMAMGNHDSAKSYAETAEGSAAPSNTFEVNRLAGVEPEPYDPFAPENLRLPQEFLDQAMAAPLLTTIPVEKPNDQEFVRVHPGANYRHVAALIEYREEKGARYLIHPTFTSQIGAIKYHIETLYLYTNRQGKVALWPVKVPKDNRENRWLESAAVAVEKAMSQWVQVSSNQKEGFYETVAALGEFPEPDWADKTQGKTMSQLLAIAFKERLIMDATHPVIQKLRGLI